MAPVDKLVPWLSSLGHGLIQKRASIYPDAMRCNTIPYGAVGFVGDLIAVFIVAAISDNVSPLTRKQIRHRSLSLWLGIIQLIACEGLLIYSVTRCWDNVELVLMAIARAIFVFFTIITLFLSRTDPAKISPEQAPVPVADNTPPQQEEPPKDEDLPPPYETIAPQATDNDKFETIDIADSKPSLQRSPTSSTAATLVEPPPPAPDNTTNPSTPSNHTPTPESNPKPRKPLGKPGIIVCHILLLTPTVLTITGIYRLLSPNALRSSTSPPAITRSAGHLFGWVTVIFLFCLIGIICAALRPIWIRVKRDGFRKGLKELTFMEVMDLKPAEEEEKEGGDENGDVERAGKGEGEGDKGKKKSKPVVPFGMGLLTAIVAVWLSNWAVGVATGDIWGIHVRMVETEIGVRVVLYWMYVGVSKLMMFSF